VRNEVRERSLQRRVVVMAFILFGVSCTKCGRLIKKRVATRKIWIRYRIGVKPGHSGWEQSYYCSECHPKTTLHIGDRVFVQHPWEYQWRLK
jgi:hypothetical protein